MAEYQGTIHPIPTITVKPYDASTYRGFFTYLTVFGGYLIIFFIGLGLFGNILSIVIFIRQRHRDSASSVYLGTLAVSDLGNLLTGLLLWSHQSLYYMTYSEINVPQAWSDLACKCTMYIMLICNTYSGWIIMAFSFERMIAVLLPLKVSNIATNKRRKIVLSTLFIVFAAIWSHAFILYRMYGPYPPGHLDRVICHFDVLDYPAWVNIGFCAQFFILINITPSLSICVLNVIIIIGITRKDKNIDASDLKRAKREMRCLSNLLAVSTAYVLLMSPMAIMWGYTYYESFTGWQGRTLAYIDFVSEVTYYMNSIALINYGTNFIIYTVALDFYREEVKAIFSCCFKSRTATK